MTFDITRNFKFVIANLLIESYIYIELCYIFNRQTSRVNKLLIYNIYGL